MSNLAQKLINYYEHNHRWNDIIQRNENGEEVIIGRHCFWCGHAEKYPMLAELGETQEFELVDPRDFTKPKEGNDG